MTLVFTGSFPATMRFPTSSAFLTSRKNLACRVHPGWDSNVMVSADAIAIAADRFSMLLTRFDGIVSSLPGEAFPRPTKENEERERERRAKS